MKFRLFVLLGLMFVILSSGCGFDKIFGDGFGAYRIDELYFQEIDGSSKRIYYFDAWGGLDSHKIGFSILDSNETFDINTTNTKGRLDLLYFIGIPSNTVIKGITHECYGSCGEDWDKSVTIFPPMKIATNKIEGIDVISYIYQYKGFAESQSWYQTFQFDSFVETKDSLFFYNLMDTTSLETRHIDDLKLSKGEVYIKENKKSEVSFITINQIIINSNDSSIQSIKTIRLFPKNTLYPTQFSNIGIFKQVQL